MGRRWDRSGGVGVSVDSWKVGGTGGGGGGGTVGKAGVTRPLLPEGPASGVTGRVGGARPTPGFFNAEEDEEDDDEAMTRLNPWGLMVLVEEEEEKEVDKSWKTKPKMR